MSNRKLISRHLLSWQTSWSSRSVRRKQWLWKAFHVGWQIEAWANQSSSFTLKMSYSGPVGHWFFRWWEEWTENMGFGWWFWLAHITGRNTWNHHQFCWFSFGTDPKLRLKDTKICSEKPFSVSISTSCSDFLHRHKTEPRPERHRL